jgi:hypothetical protein
MTKKGKKTTKETDKQFYKRLGINHSSKKCEDKWKKHHDKIAKDFKEGHGKEIWEGCGNFGGGKKNYKISWRDKI